MTLTLRKLTIGILLLPLIFSCGGMRRGNYVPKTGRVKVKPHDDLRRENTYCKYEIVKDLPEGALLKVGDVICIFCPADKDGCDDYTEVEEGDGKVYIVKQLTKGLPCTTCPKGTDTPPGNPRETR